MRTLIGIVIVLVGLQLLLSSLNVANVPSLGDWWPVILIAIGLISWKSNPRMFFWPIIMVGLGVIFLLENLNVLPGNAWNYVWPGIIILVGFSVMSGRKWEKWGKHQGSGDHVASVFSGREERVVGDFSKGSVSATFGGTKYDLRGATIADNADVEAFASFGGIEIVVPKDVTVRLKVTPIFGGSENKTNPDPNVKKTLTISGTALFGGIEVKN
ncbi:MAG: DUF5668 domain-containing protein [Patescibacteria group bacterium]